MFLTEATEFTEKYFLRFSVRSVRDIFLFFFAVPPGSRR